MDGTESIIRIGPPLCDRQPGTGWSRYPQSSSTYQWMLKAPCSAWDGRVITNQMASPVIVSATWRVSIREGTEAGSGWRVLAALHLWTSLSDGSFFSSSLCKIVWRQGRSSTNPLYQLFILLSVICPYSNADLKTWGLLHLRLENLPKMYTAKFSLCTGPQNHKGISSDSLIVTLCFWSALNVFLVTNRL